MVHGYGDHSARYGAMVEALVKEGFAVHGFDHRGHGRAQGRRGYAEQWPEFVDDLASFWQRVRAQSGEEKTFLFAHSHGALIALHALGQGALPGLAGLIFSAPYFRLAIKPPWFKYTAAMVISKVLPWAPFPTEITPPQLTRDPVAQQDAREDPLYLRIVTPGWFVQSSEAFKQVLPLASRVQVPLWVFVGENDGIADPAAARSFVDAVPGSDKKFVTYPGMMHEPWNELGKETLFKDISGWISSHL